MKIKPVYFTETLQVKIDFPGANIFRLTTAFRQREFELSKCKKYALWELRDSASVIDLESLKVSELSKTVFYLAIDDANEYLFRALTDSSWQTVSSTQHFKPKTVVVRVTRVK